MDKFRAIEKENESSLHLSPISLGVVGRYALVWLRDCSPDPLTYTFSPAMTARNLWMRDFDVGFFFLKVYDSCFTSVRPKKLKPINSKNSETNRFAANSATKFYKPKHGQKNLRNYLRYQYHLEFVVASERYGFEIKPTNFRLLCLLSTGLPVPHFKLAIPQKEKKVNSSFTLISH